MTGSLTVHEFGNSAGPSVVLLHGLTESGRTWPDVVDRWGELWHLLAVDLRGHGESPRFSEVELGDVPWVMLTDVLDVLNDVPEPVAVVGHSLGGLLALRAAAAGARVCGLVLEDPARPSGDRVADPDFVQRQEEFLDAMIDPGEAVARMRVESTWTDAEIAAWADSKALVDRNYIRRGLYLGDARFEELFNALTVPTLLVVPEGSDMAPADRDIANPLVHTERVPGAGHCVRRDRPDRYHAVVDPFLSALLES